MTALRLAAPADAEMLARIHALADPPGWRASDFAALLTNPANFALLTEEGAGFILASAVDNESDILQLAVKPEMRRKGHGTRLLRAACAEATKRGVRTLYLEVAADNESARALYAQAGFVEAGTRKAYYHRNDGAVDALILRAALD